MSSGSCGKFGDTRFVSSVISTRPKSEAYGVYRERIESQAGGAGDVMSDRTPLTTHQHFTGTVYRHRAAIPECYAYATDFGR